MSLRDLPEPLTADQKKAEEEINAIMYQKSHPLHDRWRAGEKDARDHMERLHRRLTNNE